MKQWQKRLLGVLIFAVLLCVLWCLFWMVWGITPAESASLGIIGGADGPTAIIVAKTP